MKKTIMILLASGVALFQFCSSPKNAQATQQKITYTDKIQPLIAANCSPCHIPPKGNKEPLHTYETAKANIDESIRRIQLNPTDRGFMPFKHPKLADSTINYFVKWKEDGLLEK